MATKGIVKGIVSNLVTVEVDGPVSQNEICYISVGGVKLMSEVIKVIGKNAFVQVFESTVVCVSVTRLNSRAYVGSYAGSGYVVPQL